MIQITILGILLVVMPSALPYVNFEDVVPILPFCSGVKNITFSDDYNKSYCGRIWCWCDKDLLYDECGDCHRIEVYRQEGCMGFNYTDILWYECGRSYYWNSMRSFQRKAFAEYYTKKNGGVVRSDLLDFYWWGVESSFARDFKRLTGN